MTFRDCAVGELRATNPNQIANERRSLRGQSRASGAHHAGANSTHLALPALSERLVCRMAGAVAPLNVSCGKLLIILELPRHLRHDKFWSLTCETLLAVAFSVSFRFTKVCSRDALAPLEGPGHAKVRQNILSNFFLRKLPKKIQAMQA